MTIRPAYTRDEANSEWIQIGPGAVESPVYYQATEPTSAPTGSIWVNSSVDIPTAYTNNYRWQYTATGGETSLSGSGLVYTPGYEQVYLNGVLLVRGQDYTATTGSTISGLTALVAGDSVELIIVGTYPVADTYTQSQADSKFSPKTAVGMSLVVPASVSVGSGTGAVATNGQVTFTGASSITLNGCFSANYQNYRAIMNVTSITGANTGIGYKNVKNGAVDSTFYYVQELYINGSGTTATRVNNTDKAYLGSTDAGYPMTTTVDIYNPFLNRTTEVTTFMHRFVTSVGMVSALDATSHQVANSFDGMQIVTDGSSSLTGTIRVYGYNNGA